jgi:hypothetical protein
VSRAYETTNRRYIDTGDQAGRNRQRRKLCPDDGGALENRGGILSCTTCDWTAGVGEVAR